MSPPLGTAEVLKLRGQLDRFAERFAERARNHDRNLSPADAQRLRDQVLARCRRLLDDWYNIADEFRQTNTRLQYQRWEAGAAQRLLYDMWHYDRTSIPEIQEPRLVEKLKRILCSSAVRATPTSRN